MQGFVIVNKEKGFTSHDVVAKCRGIFGQKRIGHTGTLDPEAEGVLIVCLGKATKAVEDLSAARKTYRATLRLGIETDTQDTTGTVIKTGNVPVEEDLIKSTMASFVGDSLQTPPMYSAKKVQGKKLYELAREGKEVARKQALITVYGLTIEAMNLPDVIFTADVSKGTYIRTLCHDIGQKLGCGGAMAALFRTHVGAFDVSQSFSLAELQSLKEKGHLNEAVHPIEEIYAGCSAMQIRPDYEKMLLNGNRLPKDGLISIKKNTQTGEDPRRKIRVYDSKGRFFALYEADPEKSDFKPDKIFAEI